MHLVYIYIYIYIYSLASWIWLRKWVVLINCRHVWLKSSIQDRQAGYVTATATLCCIDLVITIKIIMQIRVYFISTSVLGDTRREAQTILYWPPPFVISHISTHLCRSRLKLICFDQIRKKPNRALQRSNLKLIVFSKSSNSSDHLFHTLNSLQWPSSPVSCLVV